MKNRYLKLVLGGSLILGYYQSLGQIHINGTNLTNFGYMSNFDSNTEITNIPGSIYQAGDGAIFDHNETGTNTLIVNNTYNANGPGGSFDNFNGPNGVAGVQTIAGSVAPNFSTMAIKNGVSSIFNINNTAGANVFNSVSFQNGITTTIRTNTASGALRFQIGTSYTGGLTDAQHVNGYVGKVGNSAFVFPVGSGSDSRTLAISAPTSSSALISTAYYLSSIENPNSFAAPIKSVYENASWDWIPNFETDDDGLTVTISIPGLATFAGTSDLRLVGWDRAQWIDLSSSPTANGNSEGSTLSGVIPSGINITQIGIGSIMTPLPVKLLSFTASIVEQSRVLLTWKTSEEVNSHKFELREVQTQKIGIIWEL